MATARQAGLKGVGGGLLFFCICLTVLWPVWTVGNYIFYGFGFSFNWQLLLSQLDLVFGIVVGITLWMKTPAAMILLRIYFALDGLLTLWSLGTFAQYVLRFHEPLFSFARTLITGFGPSIAFLVFGIIYFSVSERVRATYGSKLF